MYGGLPSPPIRRAIRRIWKAVVQVCQYAARFDGFGKPSYKSANMPRDSTDLESRRTSPPICRAIRRIWKAVVQVCQYAARFDGFGKPSYKSANTPRDSTDLESRRTSPPIRSTKNRRAAKPVQIVAALAPAHIMSDFPAIEVIGRTEIIVQQGSEAIDLILRCFYRSIKYKPGDNFRTRGGQRARIGVIPSAGW